MSSRNPSFVRLQTLVGLLSLLMVAFILDRWIEVARAEAAVAFNSLFAILLAAFGYLLLAIGVLVLFKILDRQGGRDLWIAIIYTIMGGLIMLIPIAVAIFSENGLGIEILSDIWIYAIPDSRVSVMGTFITAVGLINLLQKQKKS